MTDGNYSLIVVTNVNGDVFERGATANNTAVSASTIGIGHPDLAIQSVSAPSAPQSGQSVTINWTGKNIGQLPTGTGWTDDVYLTTGGTVTGTSVLLGTVNQTASLAAGASYNAQLVANLPDGISGSYQIVVVTNAANTVNEGPTGGANDSTASSAFNIALAPYPALTVGNVTAPALTIGDPVSITVSWTVTNDGSGAINSATGFDDRVVLSTNSTYGDGDDIVIGDFVHSGGLAAGKSYTQTQTIALPAGTTGHFILFVKTDALGAVYQYNNTHPTVASPSNYVDVIPEPYAALNVTGVTTASAAISGQAVNLGYSVTNNGIGATDEAQWNDTVYISPDPTGATGLQQIDQFTHVGALGVGASYSNTVTVTLPTGVGGTEYLFVNSSGPYQFIYTSGNTGRSNPIQVTYVAPPLTDLQVTAVSGPTAGTTGSTALVTWTVKDNGPAAASGSWNDTVYAAPNGNFNDAVALGYFTYTAGLGAGLSYTRTEQVTLPSAAGIYEFFVMTDTGHVLNDSNLNNNLLASAPLTLTPAPKPELEVSGLTVPTEVNAGGVIDVNFTVSNLGTAATPTGQSHWTDSVYASLVNSINGGAILLGTLPNGSALAVGQSYSSSGTFTLPQALSGNVFIIVQTNSNNAVDEGMNQNNPASVAVAALAVNAAPVEPPDLVTSDVTTVPDAFDGNAITVHYMVSNLGTGVTYPSSWYDAVYLTLGKDRPDPQRGDILLGELRP